MSRISSLWMRIWKLLKRNYPLLRYAEDLYLFMCSLSFYWHFEQVNEWQFLFRKGQVESLRKERDMLKLVESRLNQEKETILSQRQSQNVLLSNLQTIQVHVVLMLCTLAYAAHCVKAQFCPFSCPVGYTWEVRDRHSPASHQSAG